METELGNQTPKPGNQANPDEHTSDMEDDGNGDQVDDLHDDVVQYYSAQLAFSHGNLPESGDEDDL